MKDDDIYHAATVMLKRYGNRAEDEASARAERAIDMYDREKWGRWLRIALAIAVLKDSEPTRRSA